jgi:uncharacterized OB-fold protein
MTPDTTRRLFVREDGEAGPPAHGDRLRLVGSSCPACGRVAFPAVDACAACFTPAAEVLLPAEGTVALNTSVLHPPPGALVPVPYHLGFVALGERSVTGLLVGAVGEPGTGLIGRPATTVAHVIDDEHTTYAFAVGPEARA